MFKQELFNTYIYTNIDPNSNQQSYEKTLIFLHGASESASTYRDKYLDGTIELPENTKIVII